MVGGGFTSPALPIFPGANVFGKNFLLALLAPKVNFCFCAMVRSRLTPPPHILGPGSCKLGTRLGMFGLGFRYSRMFPGESGRKPRVAKPAMDTAQGGGAFP